MSNSSKFATTLSVSALFVSVVNVALTSPLLLEMYLQPKLVGTEANREIDGDNFRSFFVVKNEGRGTAKSVDIVLNAHHGDFVQVMQGFVGKVEEEPNGPPLKTVRIRSDYLAPNESILIIVTGNKKDLLEDAKAYDMKDLRPVGVTIPAYVSIRSERGLGDVSSPRSWAQTLLKTSQ
ncbi:MULTISPECIES: hypothetical protein [unclassified Pseudomonas]|uniref:hypothetical protein n=1 Tax=unclassified Pseudomonas TaxID=196821 RepID=UPI000A1FBA85|nr:MULTISPECIES: hypothetical protein [unclassified Pseudomonas]